MAPVQTNHDYYAILEIEQTADANSIRASYRRLAKIKHPDKNLTNPNATLEFQLVRSSLAVQRAQHQSNYLAGPLDPGSILNSIRC